MLLVARSSNAEILELVSSESDIEVIKSFISEWESMLVMQVRDTSPAMDCSKPDHDGGADGEHRHHPGVSVPLPLGHRDGSLVDHLLRRPRALHLPDPGRHRREAGEAHQDQQPPGGAV